ncbi:hypothetical protein ACWJKU_02235 [Methylocaldum sp. MU1018]
MKKSFILSGLASAALLSMASAYGKSGFHALDKLSQQESIIASSMMEDSELDRVEGGLDLSGLVLRLRNAMSLTVVKRNLGLSKPNNLVIREFNKYAVTAVKPNKPAVQEIKAYDPNVPKPNDSALHTIIKLDTNVSNLGNLVSQALTNPESKRIEILKQVYLSQAATLLKDAKTGASEGAVKENQVDRSILLMQTCKSQCNQVANIKTLSRI